MSLLQCSDRSDNETGVCVFWIFCNLLYKFFSAMELYKENMQVTTHLLNNMNTYTFKINE